jgi:predicted nucleic acid-binding protein
MLEAIILDAHPLGLACQRRGKSEADACRQWLVQCAQAGLRILVPEVADYEVRRELLRSRKRASLARLDRFISSAPVNYLPITTVSMRRAAELWAQSRQAGLPTADPQALDADVILAAQALTMGIAADRLVVATSNTRHLARFVPADHWRNIPP